MSYGLVRLACAAIVVASLLASPAAGNAPNGSFKDCDVCPEMVVVPAGSFVMGSPADEEGHSADEEPQHRVTIGRPFAVGKYEVTAAEWDACVAEAACAGERASDRVGDRLPVTRVSWDEVQIYIRWLSQRTGKQYRLLSEAEWEYAARGGTTTPYHTGRTILPGQANVASKPIAASGFAVGITGKQTVPVGSYAPNGFGLHDVHGNVWEWVQDCVNDGYAGAPTDGSAWTSGKCERRIMRGGAWVDYPASARSATRGGLGAQSRGRTLGFRVARTLD